MVKLICPHCMKPVPVPDDFSGREVTCPSCLKPFEVPARYHPAVLADPVPPAARPAEAAASAPPAVAPAPTPVRAPEPPAMSPEPPPTLPDRPAPPPGFVPPAPPAPAYPAGAGPTAAPAVPAVAGYTHARGITISPNAVAWLPAVFLAVILFLTFLDWVGSYVGGTAVYSQNAWRAVSGSPYQNLRLETMMKQDAAWPTEVFNKMTSDWKIMVPYLLALFLTTAFAWGDRLIGTVDRAHTPRQLGWLAGIWPHRSAILAGLAVLTLVLILVQSGVGFGLERAMRQVVSESFAEKRQAAAGKQADLDRVAFQEDEAMARFKLERTTWFELVIVLHVLVVLAILLRAWLARRGDRPPPRLVLHY